MEASGTQSSWRSRTSSTANAEPIGFRALHDALLAAYGPQFWWPADDPFEVMVGALLVQRTTWRNAALALARLRQSGLLRPSALAATEADALAPLIRSAGFFRVKASRLRQLAAFVAAAGDMPALDTWSTARLRGALLDLDGVGPETADSILLYAFNRPVAVIDEYLRRLVRRLAANSEIVADEFLREAVLAEFDDAPRLNEFHALVVEHGKRFCASRPRCVACILNTSCGSGLGINTQSGHSATGTP